MKKSIVIVLVLLIILTGAGALYATGNLNGIIDKIFMRDEVEITEEEKFDEILGKIKENLDKVESVHAKINTKETSEEDDLLKMEEEFVEQHVDFISDNKKRVTIISKKSKESIFEIYVDLHEKKLKDLLMINYSKKSGIFTEKEIQELEKNFPYIISNNMVNNDIYIDGFLAEMSERMSGIFPDSNFLYYVTDLANEFSGPWSLTKSVEQIKEKLDDEIINGKDCYHYKVLIKRENFTPYLQFFSLLRILGRFESEDIPSSLKEEEIWVGKDDFLVYKEKYKIGYGTEIVENDMTRQMLEELEKTGRTMPRKIASNCIYEVIYFDFNKDTKTKVPSENIMTAELRDRKRKSSLENIGLAIELYWNDFNQYPIAINLEKVNDENSNFYKSIAPNYLSALQVEEFLFDPKHPEFYYTYKSDGQSYELIARLENLEDENCVIENEICLYKIEGGIKSCENSGGKDMCFCKLGIQASNPLFCEKCKEYGGEESYVNECYYIIATKKGDSSLCEKCSTDTETFCSNDRCYHVIALQKKDFQLCEKIKKDDLRSLCKREVSPPDLIITDVKYEVNEADHFSQVRVFFWITIHNQGLSDINIKGDFDKPFMVNVYDTERNYESDEAESFNFVYSLKAGETKEIKTSTVHLNKDGREYVTVKIKIDNDNIVKEIDETNNEFIKKILITEK